MDGTDTSRKRDARSSAGHHKSEDTSDSREDDTNVSEFVSFFSQTSLLRLITPTPLLLDLLHANVHVQRQPLHTSEVSINTKSKQESFINLFQIQATTTERSFF